MLYSHMQIHAEHNDTKTSDTVLRKIYLSLYLKGLCVWKGVGHGTELQYIDPTLMAISGVSFSLSRAAQPEARGPTLLGTGFLYHILSPTDLLSKLTDFLSLPSYIIAHSISLEWHVWSSSSGNNCHAVHRSLSSGASVYDCTMGFYHDPYCQQSQPTRFLPITAIGMCHFLPVHHFGMACLAGSKVNIQQIH